VYRVLITIPTILSIEVYAPNQRYIHGKDNQVLAVVVITTWNRLQHTLQSFDHMANNKTFSHYLNNQQMHRNLAYLHDLYTNLHYDKQESRKIRHEIEFSGLRNKIRCFWLKLFDKSDLTHC
jgi:hypothetical protein